jgi:hypothetical protein
MSLLHLIYKETNKKYELRFSKQIPGIPNSTSS